MKDKTSEQLVLDFISETCNKQKNKGQVSGCTTNFVAEKLEMQRANVSSALNKLCREGKVVKTKGKPVIYTVGCMEDKDNKVAIVKSSGFDALIGSNDSLKKAIQQAKAAILYPPNGLHILLLGPTGAGKTMFAELVYKFAIENGVLDEAAPFISFNCADYANNPQLLLAHLFGAKKGSYTGADADRIGLVQKANKGILFLDEVHRLPPEGQEMFFYLLDKGLFRALGDVGEYKKVDLIIICATTENKDSALLTTFTRRIPMVIAFPFLKDRSFAERFDLLNEFFKAEAVRTSKEIKVTADAVKSLLLYNCIGNIGQLKNDIQLGCANGFLKCIVNEEQGVNVDLNELPEYIRKGLVNYKAHKKEIDGIIDNNSIFYYNSQKNWGINESENLPAGNTFYETIEERINTLKARGLTQADISLILSLDIDKYFKKYIYKINKDINIEELSKVVDKKVILIVEDFLSHAAKELKRVFPERIFYGLCLHIASSIERIKLNKPIENYKMDEIIERYPEEFRICIYFADTLEKEFGILIPKDEIGFLTMFITDELINQEKNYEKPVVLIAMHGNSTASSMADVVNKLMGEENTFGYDMPLDKATELAYQELKEYALTIHRGGGILLLVDMGSLSMFGELISEETGIKIRVIDMVTTLIALETSRKAALGNSIDEIYNEVIHKNAFNINYNAETYPKLELSKDNVMITVCLTGEGSAVKLKAMVEEQLSLEDRNIQVIPMSINDREDMVIKVKRISKTKNILAVIGTINPELHGIPFISASELFLDKDYKRLKSIIEKDLQEANEKYSAKEICLKVIESFKDNIKTYDLNLFYELFLNLLQRIEEDLKINIDIDTLVGTCMHVACVIDRLITNKQVSNFNRKDVFISLYKEELEILKNSLHAIEEGFDITINEDEQCYIYSLLKKV